jgi:rhamnulokinase
MTATIAAIDLGASSGRVITARFGDGKLDLSEIHRFPNQPVTVAGTLHWDILGLHEEILAGLRKAGPVDSVGIDTWAVDYGLLDASGALLGNPVHYRDARTETGVAIVHAWISPERLYARNGLQFLPFNTLYQLAAEPLLNRAETLLLIPDLITYWLTGQRAAERTNASTTGLYEPGTGQWSDSLIGELSLPRGIFPDLTEPGTPAGLLLPETGLGGVPMTTVASHDTASAIAAIPAETDHFAYVSCGTWSLAGVELTEPILSDAGRAANFTNEAGVDGTIRYLRNVMGLWLLQECQRVWHDRGLDADLDDLLAAAAARPAFGCVVDPDDPVFLPPGDMPARIADACRRLDQPAPADPPAIVRCIVDSLALAHRRALVDAQRLAGRTVDVVHIVGGGARNELLCQLTADACGLPIEAGPVEAGAIGNALVQARALGAVGPDLTALRALVRSTQRIRRYEPPGDRAAAAAAARLTDARST